MWLCGCVAVRLCGCGVLVCDMECRLQTLVAIDLAPDRKAVTACDVGSAFKALGLMWEACHRHDFNRTFGTGEREGSPSE